VPRRLAAPFLARAPSVQSGARTERAGAGLAPHLRRPRGQCAKLGLHLASDVIQQVLVILVVQQLLTAHLRPRSPGDSVGAKTDIILTLRVR